jgi:hypothetical protein
VDGLKKLGKAAFASRPTGSTVLVAEAMYLSGTSSSDDAQLKGLARKGISG